MPSSNPGTEPMSPALQMDPLLSEPPGKSIQIYKILPIVPKKTGGLFPPLQVVFNPRPCTAFSCPLSLLFFHLEQSQSLAFFILIFLRHTNELFCRISLNLE